MCLQYLNTPSIKQLRKTKVRCTISGKCIQRHISTKNLSSNRRPWWPWTRRFGTADHESCSLEARFHWIWWPCGRFHWSLVSSGIKNSDRRLHHGHICAKMNIFVVVSFATFCQWFLVRKETQEQKQNRRHVSQVVWVTSADKRGV
jgi:hypothetical protein